MEERKKFRLVLDVGTTGIKAFVFDEKFRQVTKVYQKLKKRFPRRGWVEQDPHELVEVSRQVLRQAIKESKAARADFLGLGITNQRETTILWDKKTGLPIYSAIVWEDTRTKNFCRWLQFFHGRTVLNKTGLPIDPYFSASKINWLLHHLPAAKILLDKKRLLFGTVDSWLLWNFCQGHPHLTDETNASRTLLFNLRTRRWDKELLKIFEVPAQILPPVQRPSPCCGQQ